MHFAYPLPWWLAVILAAAIGAVAYVEYRRPLSPLTRASARPARRPARARARRAGAVPVPSDRRCCRRPAPRDAIVPVLVDVSRSMRLADADGQTRIARAQRAAEKRARCCRCSRASRPSCMASATASAPANVGRARRRRAARPISPARSPRFAIAIAVSASPASSLLSDGGDTGRGTDRPRRGAGRRCRRPAGVRRSASDRPTACAIAKCWASRPAIRGSIRRRSICTCRRSASDSAARRSRFACSPTAA